MSLTGVTMEEYDSESGNFLDNRNYYAISKGQDGEQILVLSAYTAYKSEADWTNSENPRAASLNSDNLRLPWYIGYLNYPIFKGWEFWGCEQTSSGNLTTRGMLVNNTRIYTFRVTNTTKFRALASMKDTKNVLTIAAYEVSDGVRSEEFADTAMLGGEEDFAYVLTLDLMGSKTYDIQITCPYKESSYVYELAFTVATGNDEETGSTGKEEETEDPEKDNEETNDKEAGLDTGNISIDSNDTNVSRKIVENGHVYIVRNGVKYNILGSVVK